MAVYTSLRATAQRLIQKNGRTVTYSIKSAVLIDTSNPQLGTVGATTSTLKAAFINSVVSEKSKNLVQSGDKICLIAADDLPGIVPSTKDSIIDGGVTYDIENIDSIDPSDAPVVYEFILRA